MGNSASIVIRPSKKTNMFSVRVSKKKEGGGAFYFLFFIFKMAAILFKISNIHCFFYCSNTIHKRNMFDKTLNIYTVVLFGFCKRQDSRKIH